MRERGVLAVVGGSEHHSVYANPRQHPQKEESILRSRAFHLRTGTRSLFCPAGQPPELRRPKSSQSRLDLHRNTQTMRPVPASLIYIQPHGSGPFVFIILPDLAFRVTSENRKVTQEEWSWAKPNLTRCRLVEISTRRRYRWENGRRRSKKIGTVSQYPTKASAWRAAKPLRDAVENQVRTISAAPTVSMLVEQYRLEKMPTRRDTRGGYEDRK